MPGGLDSTGKLAEYVHMHARDETVEAEYQTQARLPRHWPTRLAWAVGLLAAAAIVALAFGAYRQPELLLNLMGLRYCG